jgi:hypothetical protein
MSYQAGDIVIQSKGPGGKKRTQVIKNKDRISDNTPIVNPKITTVKEVDEVTTTLMTNERIVGDVEIPLGLPPPIVNDESFAPPPIGDRVLPALPPIDPILPPAVDELTKDTDADINTDVLNDTFPPVHRGPATDGIRNDTGSYIIKDIPPGTTPDDLPKKNSYLNDLITNSLNAGLNEGETGDDDNPPPPLPGNSAPNSAPRHKPIKENPPASIDSRRYPNLKSRLHFWASYGVNFTDSDALVNQDLYEGEDIVYPVFDIKKYFPDPDSILVKYNPLADIEYNFSIGQYQNLNEFSGTRLAARFNPDYNDQFVYRNYDYAYYAIDIPLFTTLGSMDIIPDVSLGEFLSHDPEDFDKFVSSKFPSTLDLLRGAGSIGKAGFRAPSTIIRNRVKDSIPPIPPLPDGLGIKDILDKIVTIGVILIPLLLIILVVAIKV